MYSLGDPTDDPELPEWAASCTSFSLETISSHRQIPNLESKIKREEVECITFEDLLNEASTSQIDMIQIDVEGYDFEILELIDFSKIKPAIIRFEHIHLSIEDHSSAIVLLGNHGYKVLL